MAIARSLCLKPKVLLFDEPTASLDPANSKNLGKILKLLSQKGYVIGLVTQDMEFAKEVASKVYFMESGSIVDSFDDKQIKEDSLLIQKRFFQQQSPLTLAG